MGRDAILDSIAGATEVDDVHGRPFHSDGNGGGSRDGGRGESVDDGELAFFPLTELGNAERFARRMINRLRYAATLGWLWWDGHRWSREGADEVALRLAFDVARAIQNEAQVVRDRGLDVEVEPGSAKRPAVMLSDKIERWGRASESASRLHATLKLASAFLATAVSAFDADPLAINVLNGTLRIDPDRPDGDMVTLHPHNPADLITLLAPVIYDPQATAPNFDRFLGEVLPDPNVRRFLAAWSGYSLTGLTDEQVLVFLFGSGRNGKSTLVDLVGDVVGDYGAVIPPETFAGDGRVRGAAQASPDLASLPGKRFVRTSEPGMGAKLDESLLKQVTGGEPITARHLNRDFFSFKPVFKLTMSGNHRPVVRGADEGIWRRIKLVPFTVTVPTPDPNLGRRLRGELSGVLNWILDGLRDYLDHGMPWPDQVIQATREYREDSDPLGRFLEDATVNDTGTRTSATRLHKVYVAWCRSTGEPSWSIKGLGGAMKDRGFTSLRSNGMHWLDLRLTKSELDYDSAATEAPDPDGGADDDI